MERKIVVIQSDFSFDCTLQLLVLGNYMYSCIVIGDKTIIQHLRMAVGSALG